jgi:hypothetical protein
MNFAKAAHPKLTGGWRGQSSVQWTLLPSGKTKKTPYPLTSEMPHLGILPRSRLGQNLTRRNALQLFGYVPVEHILSARRRC